MIENPEMGLYLGLDTSAYTTSLALVDQDENLIFDNRLALSVEMGNLGLRQSEAVFEHINNLPDLWGSGRELLKDGSLKAVVSSTRPRPIEGSYMPVFKVSEAFGLFLSQTMGLQFWASSHQEGHVLAGLWSAGIKPGCYIVLHLSGGTTEILSAEEKCPGNLTLELLGGTADLNAGQFVDRIGRAMGLNFPAGPQLEILAKKGVTGNLQLPVAVKGSEISFSGPASQAERLIAGGCSKKDLARAVEVCIADSLSLAVQNISINPKDYQGLLAVGGVTANRFIGARLIENILDWKLFFAQPELASDNAVGLAIQAARYSLR